MQPNFYLELLKMYKTVFKRFLSVAFFHLKTSPLGEV